MTERDFWLYLNSALTRGREALISGTVDTSDPQERQMCNFITGHSFLPEGYDKIPLDKIMGMGLLLISKAANRRTKEAIMILLAHHPAEEALLALKAYNAKADRGLEIYAQMALDECEMWNGG